MGDMTLDLTPRGAASIEALVNGPIQTNSYAVISNDECLIVDPAWEGERLVEHIRTAHPEVRVLGSVCTHGHADHVGGVAGVRAVVGDSALYELCAKDVTVP
ncbi:MAG: MBL fold metallo-hydrolase, partial [Collinsella sp.]